MSKIEHRTITVKHVGTGDKVSITMPDEVDFSDATFEVGPEMSVTLSN